MIAQGIADAGAKILLADFDCEALSAVQAHLYKERGIQADVCYVDISNEESVESLLDYAVKQLRRRKHGILRNQRRRQFFYEIRVSGAWARSTCQRDRSCIDYDGAYEKAAPSAWYRFKVQ